MSEIQMRDTDQKYPSPASPKVTIGMPVFNGAKYIREALDSLLSQTFTDFELIIADNASTDETKQICAEYASRDVRVRYFRHTENKGASVNFHWLLDNALGEYFMWAAHDDIWDSNWLTVLLKSFGSSDIGIRGRVRYLRGDAIVADFLPTSFPKRALVRSFMEDETMGRAHHTYDLFRTEKLKNINLTKLRSVSYGADLVLIFELLQFGALKVVSDTGYTYRLHNASESQRIGAQSAALPRLIYAAYPFAYYRAYLDQASGPMKVVIAFLIPVKHVKSQMELWWRGFRKAVLGLENLRKS